MTDEVLSRFQLKGTPLSCEPYGSGHINRTYLVVTDAPHRYILQRVNRRVFHDVPALMENIHAVTRHLAQKDPDPRHVLTLVPAADGKPYLTDAEGEYWRLYEFVGGGVCLEAAANAEDFYQSAVGRSADSPDAGFRLSGPTLQRTITRFHDTPARFAAFRAAVDADVLGRRSGAQEEIAFALAREGEAGTLTDMLARGELPLRVTHNDTKLNNVILDEKDHSPLCVFDLDTDMTGLVATIRRFHPPSRSTAREDERT